MKWHSHHSCALMLFAVFLALGFTGCARAQVGASGAKTNGCPPVQPWQGEQSGWKLGEATYQAQQVGDEVIITAMGEHRTAGYQQQLVRDKTKIFPPRLMFHVKAPEGMAAQVITPFRVCVSFRAGQPVGAVTVRDSQGAHTVKVERGGEREPLKR